MNWNPNSVFRVEVLPNRGVLFVDTKTNTPQMGFGLNGDSFQRLATDYLNGDFNDPESRVKRKFFERMKKIAHDSKILLKPMRDKIKLEHDEHRRFMTGIDGWLNMRKERHIKTLKEKGWSDKEIKTFILNDWKEKQIQKDKRREELEEMVGMGKDVEPVGDYMQTLLRKKFKWPSTRSQGKQFKSLKTEEVTPQQKGSTVSEALLLCPNCSNTYIERVHETWGKVQCPKCGFFFNPQQNLAGTY